MSRPPAPRLVGVIHLPPLPGSPRFGGDLEGVVASAEADAVALAEAGFDAVMVENFGDAPFFPDTVPPVTVAAMTRCAAAVACAAPALALGVNVLRNDAGAALAVAAATAAGLVRVNVHTGARVTDQGIVEGRAHLTVRARRALDLEDRLALWCAVSVTHSAPLGTRPLAQEARDLALRGAADAVLVTGTGTGRAADAETLGVVLDAIDVPVVVASGVTVENLASLPAAVHGVVVGSCLKIDGEAGRRVDPTRAHAFAEAWRQAR